MIAVRSYNAIFGIPRKQNAHTVDLFHGGYTSKLLQIPFFLIDIAQVWSERSRKWLRKNPVLY